VGTIVGFDCFSQKFELRQKLRDIIPNQFADDAVAGTGSLAGEDNLDLRGGRQVTSGEIAGGRNFAREPRPRFTEGRDARGYVRR